MKRFIYSLLLLCSFYAFADIDCTIDTLIVIVCAQGEGEDMPECHIQTYDVINCTDNDGGGGDGGDGGGGGGGGGSPNERDINGNGIIDSWRDIVDTENPCANNIKSSEDLGSNYGGRNTVRPDHTGIDIQCDIGDPLFQYAVVM